MVAGLAWWRGRTGLRLNILGRALLGSADFGGYMAEIDHLVIGAATLEAGTAYLERHLGQRPFAGGAHPGVGTHNMLLGLGPDQYIEIIAPDPSQGTPPHPRPCGSPRRPMSGVQARPDSVRMLQMSFGVKKTEKIYWRKNGPKCTQTGQIETGKKKHKNPPVGSGQT